jgi:tRNA G18 (ribose-2'-O)-methylase SpoU
LDRNADLEVFVAPQSLMDSVVGFPIHRGVLALAERGPQLRPAEILSTKNATLSSHAGPANVVLVLLGLANHDNVGSIFRNAAAFGIRAILLDHATCSPLYRKSIRVSAGGALIVPFSIASETEIWQALEASRFTALGLSPSASSTLESVVEQRRQHGGAFGYALVFGTEGTGLSPASLARSEPVALQMAPGFDSLNVAVASGIALYALTRSSRST